MTSTPPLSAIIALARAGALDHAWAQFSAAGFASKDDDPAALTVKGRLLKDHALRASGEQRRLYYLQSAEAYRLSATLRPDTYPLINAATLSLLSGDRAQAAQIAGEVLDRIARQPDEAETPYWRAATEAEALLLTGRTADARTALEAAIAAAPQAWEDHASTLRQFVAIHETLGADDAWLAMLRPPRSLHFAGGVADADLSTLAAWLDAERIGFGYGSLAAGTDIIVAEALIARGAEFHAVLPADVESFAAAFVDPFGPEWRARFDAALAASETVSHVRPLGAAPGPTQVALAARIAQGSAILNAERLMSETVSLNGIAPPAGAPPVAADDPRMPELSLLVLAVGGGGEAGFEDRLQDVQAALAPVEGLTVAPHLSGDLILLGLAGPQEAAAAARHVHRSLAGRMPVRVAGHHGLVATVRDPFTGAARPTEAGSAIVAAITDAIPPDTICVSQDFAAVLAASGGSPSGASWMGELDASDGGGPVSLYALDKGDPS